MGSVCGVCGMSEWYRIVRKASTGFPLDSAKRLPEDHVKQTRRIDQAIIGPLQSTRSRAYPAPGYRLRLTPASFTFVNNQT